MLPASKPLVILVGVFFICIGALLTLAVLFAERAPGVPVWAVVLASLIPFAGSCAGIYLLRAGLRMP
jgi:Kef-type K+ transport system membrane component KefB